MLVTNYLQNNYKKKFYIFSNDKFAETVVDNIYDSKKVGISCGKVINNNKSFVVDLLANFDFNYAPIYDKIKVELLELRMKYSDYYLDNYFVSGNFDEKKLRTMGIDRRTMANTLSCNQNIPNSNKIFPEPLAILHNIKDFILKTDLPYNSKNLDEKFKNLQDLLKFMYVENITELVNLECIQYFFGIRVSNNYIFLDRNYDYTYESLLRNKLKEKFSESVTIKRKISDYYKKYYKYNINMSYVENWLNNSLYV
jgi:hypothetical protein